MTSSSSVACLSRRGTPTSPCNHAVPARARLFFYGPRCKRRAPVSVVSTATCSCAKWRFIMCRPPGSRCRFVRVKSFSKMQAERWSSFLSLVPPSQPRHLSTPMLPGDWSVVRSVVLSEENCRLLPQREKQLSCRVEIFHRETNTHTHAHTHMHTHARAHTSAVIKFFSTVFHDASHTSVNHKTYFFFPWQLKFYLFVLSPAVYFLALSSL